jgi:UDP-3-O-acyl-N-acetylglucosamine deacetylase
MEQQHTISREVTIEGRSLFHGRDVRLVVKPAPPDHGVVFVRTDLPEPVRIPALIDHVVVRDRRSALQVGDAVVETCEHFLAALVGLGMDNAIVEIDGNELPLGDGSAAPFSRRLQRRGWTPSRWTGQRCGSRSRDNRGKRRNPGRLAQR